MKKLFFKIERRMDYMRRYQFSLYCPKERRKMVVCFDAPRRCWFNGDGCPISWKVKDMFFGCYRADSFESVVTGYRSAP